MPGPYTLTIHIAEDDTPLMAEDPKDENRMLWEGETSSAGHMWYSIRKGDGPAQNYGFAPQDSKSGPRSVAGKVSDTDSNTYLQPLYERTMEISEKQYKDIMKFGDAGLENNWKFFGKEYHSLKNSCVDFTWNALKHAGFEWHEPEERVHVGPSAHVSHMRPEYRGPIKSNFEGNLTPRNNINEVEKIIDPVPGSQHNYTHHGPPAKKVLAGLRQERAKAFREDPKMALEQFPEYKPLQAADKTLEAVSQRSAGTHENCQCAGPWTWTLMTVNKSASKDSFSVAAPPPVDTPARWAGDVLGDHDIEHALLCHIKPQPLLGIPQSGRSSYTDKSAHHCR